MQRRPADSDLRIYDLQKYFEPPSHAATHEVIKSDSFERVSWKLIDKTKLLLDRFPDADGASCCFVRLPTGEVSTIRFVVRGNYQLESSCSGGWVLKAGDAKDPSYWLPQNPVTRTLDAHDRILSEKSVSIVGLNISPKELTIDVGLASEFNISGGVHMDFAVWQFPYEASQTLVGLEHLSALETQRLYLWNSQTVYQALADVYLYVVHGHVYTDRFVWPRQWKICSELDAYGLYVALSGLELATRKKICDLLKRQLVCSVIARQAQDGGWYHGEWTDLMESHYRFHNGAMLLLEAAYDESADNVILDALAKGADFVSRTTDETDLGLWFLHDSLEKSVEGMNANWKQTGGRWIPNRLFGKSETNKLILNTHLDSIIVLDRYREVTGDDQYSEKVSSALSTTRRFLALRSGEQIYRLVYWAIGLTLLPVSEAEELPFHKRAIKRMTWKYFLPHMYRLKRAFPRFVMPSGLIERHLSMPHCDFNYLAVNVMDLLRLWRRYPSKDLEELLQSAIQAIADTSIMKFWAESRVGNPQQFAAVVWVEALFHMCMLNSNPVYRRYLAEAILCVEDAGLGLPPSLLGADPEAVMKAQRVPCPSSANSDLRIANLSRNGRREFLAVNGTKKQIQLTWEGKVDNTLTWLTDQSKSISNDDSPYVPPRGWLLGQGS